MNQQSSIEDILIGCGVELYDIEISSENDKAIYRVLISNRDPKESITLSKCEEISRLISPMLDLEPPIKGDYFLEVSSAGIERKLSKPKHYALSIGSLVDITLLDTTHIKGKIVEANDKSVTVEIDADSTESIEFGDINRAKTYWQW